jgi:plasmid stabilization system protein ParE
VRHHVRLTARAEFDVEAILEWFHATHAAAAGRRWFHKLNQSITTLESLPERCALAPESEELQLEIRELLVGKPRRVFRVLFQIDGQFVHILRIRRGTRDSIAKEDL